MSKKESKSDWIENKCQACGGTGKVLEMHPVKRFQPKINPPDCPACGGTGRQRKPKGS